MKLTLVPTIFATAAIAILLHSALNVSAAPSAQNPTPTDEPTKRPYIFPTPIFIPTFASATDLPPRGATNAPRTTTPLAATQPTAAPETPAPPAPTVARPNTSAIAEETKTPTPEPESDTADLARAAENALYAMGVVLFLGFLAISITAYLVYQRSQRAEKIAAIKRRLKGD